MSVRICFTRVMELVSPCGVKVGIDEWLSSPARPAVMEDWAIDGLDALATDSAARALAVAEKKGKRKS